MPSAERRLPKYAALAAPVLLFAANACSENKTQTPNPTQQPTLGGQIKPEVITPQRTLIPTPITPRNIESFDPNEGQPPETPKPVENPTNLEPYIDRSGAEVHTAFRDNYAYTFSLPPIPNAPDTLISLQSFVTGANLDSYVQDAQTREKISQLYQNAMNLENTDPNNPEIIDNILEASRTLAGKTANGENVCTTNFHNTVMRGNAALINYKNPTALQENQFQFIDSNCFEVKKYVISPEFKIKPLPDGTFVYEGVTYNDVIEYAQNLQAIYKPQTFAELNNWLQNARDNQDNPTDQQVGRNSAANILVGACERSDIAMNTLRLLVSAEPSTIGTDLHFNQCHVIFFDDQYYFDR